MLVEIVNVNQNVLSTNSMNHDEDIYSFIFL